MKYLPLIDIFAQGTSSHQSFLSIDPDEAMWNDNRVRVQWRKMVSFTPDGRHVAAVAPKTSSPGATRV